MTKIILKLNKESRKTIAANFVNSRFKDEMNELNKTANLLANDVLNKIYCVYPKEELELFTEECENIGLRLAANESDTFGHGVVASQFNEKNNYSKKQLPQNIYTLNSFKFIYSPKRDISILSNLQMDDSFINYSNLKTTKVSDLMYRYCREYKDLCDKCFDLESRCYELLKKVRTVDLLLKHWSDAYKYLPEDIEVDEPQTMSLSEKFALL